MGDVIRASAAVDDIFKDARSALHTAVAKQGVAQERAEQGLGPVLAMVDATEEELAAARTTLAPLNAALAAENDRADATINRVYDDTWNDVGRPANDRYLALMYPGTATGLFSPKPGSRRRKVELPARGCHLPEMEGALPGGGSASALADNPPLRPGHGSSRHDKAPPGPERLSPRAGRC